VHKFQAEIKDSPPVTMLHTLKCRDFGSDATYTSGTVRVIHARDVADAVLGLIETYMSADVRRNVSVCSCCRKGGKPAFD
jgi:hypothetical protein